MDEGWGLVEPKVGGLSDLLDYLGPTLLTGKNVCEACWTVWVHLGDKRSLLGVLDLYGSGR